MHFFNPVPVMALVEIIRGLQTSDATHDAVHAMATALGKTPITVRNAPGFVVNRILVPMINEAFFVLAEGLATPDDIDAGMKLGCNQPIGPLALADMIGLDVCLAVMEVYLSEFGDSQVPRLPAAQGDGGRRTPGPQDGPAGFTCTERTGRAPRCKRSARLTCRQTVNRKLANFMAIFLYCTQFN